MDEVDLVRDLVSEIGSLDNYEAYDTVELGNGITVLYDPDDDTLEFEFNENENFNLTVSLYGVVHSSLTPILREILSLVRTRLAEQRASRLQGLLDDAEEECNRSAKMLAQAGVDIPVYVEDRGRTSIVNLPRSMKMMVVSGVINHIKYGI